MASLLSYALTTVADVKELLDIPSSDTSKDNLIIRKINQATIMIERYTGRRFALTTYTDEEYNSTGTDQLVLRQRPIVSISSISSRDTSLNEADWDALDTEIFFQDNDSGIVRLLFSTFGRWNRYKVTYSAGYTTIPEDIAEAAAMLAAYLLENGTSGTAVKSKSEGQRRIEYFDQSQNSNDLFQQLGIDEILKSYANYPIGGL